MKLLFAFYGPIPEFSALQTKFPEHRFVFAQSLQEIKQEIEDTEVLLILAPNYKPDVAQVVKTKAKRLKWIQATTVGVDDIIINGFSEGVKLSKAAGIYDVNVAEQALALILAVSRQVAFSDRDKVLGLYNRDERWQGVSSIERKNACIVGYGGIGKQIAKRLKAFNTRIYACDILPGALDENADEFFRPEKLKFYLPQIDILILALPQTKENLYMIDRKELALMKPDSILINVARGKLVREAALVEALSSRKIKAAGLDVFEDEPLPENSELWKIENVVFTPHLGGKGDFNEERLAKLFSENIIRFTSGQELKNTVDLAKGF